MTHKVVVYLKNGNEYTYSKAYIYFNFECDTMLLDYKTVDGTWDIDNVYLEEVKEIEIDGVFYDNFELIIEL